MTINLQTGVYQTPQILPGARSADIQVGQKQGQQQDTAIPVRAESEDASAAPSVEEKRYQRVLSAAGSFFKDVYPLSDKSFTIFKDASGQYVTRYTSLRTGQVTYIPEPKLLQAFEIRQYTRKPVVEIQA